MRLAILVTILLVCSGCAQWMAIKQPKHLVCRDRVLMVGVERDTVIGCLGEPAVSDHPSRAVLHETYVYKDGGSKNHPASKTVRVILYTAGDIFTLFLSQILWMPAEAFLLDESSLQASVDYLRDRDTRWKARHLVERTEEGQIVRTLGDPTVMLAGEDEEEDDLPPVGEPPPPQP